ncbi:MAG: M56 family metallopeptidase [Pseudonocardiales bacterium]
MLSVYLPLLFSALFGVAAPTLGRRLPPAAATWLLSVGGLLAAAGSAASFALLGFTLVGQAPLLAARGHWSDTALRHADPVWPPIAAAAIAALLVLAARFALAAGRRLSALRAAYQLAAVLPAAGGELAVIDHPGLHAYAVPGRPGRIVVTATLLRTLNAAERRAVLAHERAHLTHRHHLHHTIVHLAAAANPLLRLLPAAVALSTERWADEDAALACRRDTVAAALTTTGAGTRTFATPAVVLAAAATDVAVRIHALRSPAPRLTPWRVTLLLGLLVATVLAVAEAAHDTEQLFEFAQYAYRIGHR